MSMPGMSRFNIVSLVARLCLPLSADRHPGDLFLQRLEAGHRLGRLLHQVVRGAAARTGPCSMPPGSRLRVGVFSATVATVLGTLAAIALVALRALLAGALLFTGMVYAPLVMPEVITGLSLLLLFVAIGLDRGFWTVTLAHITSRCASSPSSCSRGS